MQKVIAEKATWRQCFKSHHTQTDLQGNDCNRRFLGIKSILNRQQRRKFRILFKGRYQIHLKTTFQCQLFAVWQFKAEALRNTV